MPRPTPDDEVRDALNRSLDDGLLDNVRTYFTSRIKGLGHTREDATIIALQCSLLVNMGCTLLFYINNQRVFHFLRAGVAVVTLAARLSIMLRKRSVLAYVDPWAVCALVLLLGAHVWTFVATPSGFSLRLVADLTFHVANYGYIILNLAQPRGLTAKAVNIACTGLFGGTMALVNFYLEGTARGVHSSMFVTVIETVLAIVLFQQAVHSPVAEEYVAVPGHAMLQHPTDRLADGELKPLKTWAPAATHERHHLDCGVLRKHKKALGALVLLVGPKLVAVFFLATGTSTGAQGLGALYSDVHTYMTYAEIGCYAAAAALVIRIMCSVREYVLAHTHALWAAGAIALLLGADVAILMRSKVWQQFFADLLFFPTLLALIAATHSDELRAPATVVAVVVPLAVFPVFVLDEFQGIAMRHETSVVVQAVAESLVAVELCRCARPHSAHEAPEETLNALAAAIHPPPAEPV